MRATISEPPTTSERPRDLRAFTSALARCLLTALLLPLASNADADVSLRVLGERLRIDQSQISLSGVSSGAYMAQQMHTAYSRNIIGVGLIAGGPYACATGSYPPFTWFDPTGLYAATSRCSNTNPWWFHDGSPDLAHSIGETRRLAAIDAIDDPRHLSDSRVWLLSGSEDDTVPRDVVDVLERYYAEFVDRASIHHEELDDAGHAFITDDYGNACDESRSPFISDCDFDAAGALLRHIYGSLRPRADRADLDSIYVFDQTAFYDRSDRSISLHATGYVYVPARCLDGTRCRLHVAFHGCQQHQDSIGDDFYTESGFNEWAESNALVVLYPQTVAWSRGPFDTSANPKACWDWWGYSGSRFHHRDGPQMQAVAAMIDALIGERLLGAR